MNIEISEMDLDCLEPGVYLNDRVIDFYLMYVRMQGFYSVRYIIRRSRR